jgi:hypothetical protein
MHKTTLLVLACLALFVTCSAQQPNCDNLTCDDCPVYRNSTDFVYVDSTSECVINNGKAELNCKCSDPEDEGALPAARDATTTDNNNSNNNNNNNADDGSGNDINTLPPDGGSGTGIPTQSYGTSGAAMAYSVTFLATVAAFAAAVVTMA